jgi:hypothetical protein
MKRIVLLCLLGSLLSTNAATWAADSAPAASTTAGAKKAKVHDTANAPAAKKHKALAGSTAQAPAAATKTTAVAASTATVAVKTLAPTNSTITGALATDANVDYLTAPALVYPGRKDDDGNIVADGSQQKVCIPAGAPVHIWSDTGADHTVLSVDTDLTSGWDSGYTDSLPVMDCLHGRVLSSHVLYVSVEKTVPASSISKPPTSPDRNDRTYKSGFLGHPITVNRVDVAGNITQVCLARGTRISVWEDNNDLARAVININDPTAKNCSHTATVQNNDTDTYYVATREIANNINWWHLVGGVLLVPFKYYIGGDRSFTGSATVAGYLGWQTHLSQSGDEFTLAVFAGQSTISVPVKDKTQSSGANTNNVSGAAFGIGVFTSLEANPSIQYGFVLGRDYVSDNAHWINNHRGWISVQLGYSFL